MNAKFTEEQLENARGGVRAGIMMMNKRLAETKAYFAGPTYSVADLCIFANAYQIHTQFPETGNDEVAPYYMEWLRKIYARPATPKAFAYSRGMIGQRIPRDHDGSRRRLRPGEQAAACPDGQVLSEKRV